MTALYFLGMELQDFFSYHTVVFSCFSWHKFQFFPNIPIILNYRQDIENFMDIVKHKPNFD